jgi:tetrahydromethanopterin S-methyltransferase subunit G
MADLETLQSRLDAIERKLDDVVKHFSAENVVTKIRKRGRAGRIFWGIFVCALGLIWLGQNFGMEWLSSLRFWPVAVIVFGLFLIFGDRNW